MGSTRPSHHGLCGGFVYNIDWCVQCEKINFMDNCFLKRNKKRRREFYFAYFAFEYVVGNSRRLSLFGFSF
jgi:hypothetical protein